MIQEKLKSLGKKIQVMELEITILRSEIKVISQDLKELVDLYGIGKDKV